MSAANRSSAKLFIAVSCLTTAVLAGCGQSGQQVLATPTAPSAVIGSAPEDRKPDAKPEAGIQREVQTMASQAGRAPAIAGVPEKGRIIGFRGSLVTLYVSSDGADAERVQGATLPLPMVYRTTSASRVLVDTVQGPRWISVSEVTLGPNAN